MYGKPYVILQSQKQAYNTLFRRPFWGKDILVLTVIASALTAGIAAAPVAGIEAYRALSFKKKFLEFITSTLADIGEGKATMSTTVAVKPKEYVRII